MDPNEVAILLDEVEDGSRLTKKEMSYHEKTKDKGSGASHSSARNRNPCVGMCGAGYQ